MGTAVRKKTWRGAFGMVAAMAAFLALVAVSSGGDVTRGTAFRPEVGADRLKQARKAIGDAEDRIKAGGAPFDKSIRRASERLRAFITTAFRGYEYLDTCDTADLVTRVLDVYAGVTRGFFQQGNERSESLGEALTGARDLVETVEGCALGFESRADEVLVGVRTLVRQHEDGKVGDRSEQRKYLKLQLQVRDESRNLIAASPDQVNGGCEVPGFYRNLESYVGWATNGVLTTPPFLLGFKPPKNAKQRDDADAVAKVVRRNSVEGAHDATTRMLRTWNACSPPECQDGIDNDGDGASDEGDVGCKSGVVGEYERADESENKAEMPAVACPQAGTTATPDSPATHTLTNANAGDRAVGLVLHNVSTGQPIFVLDAAIDSDVFASGGPVSLGDAVCGPGTTTMVSWRVEGTSVTWDFTFLKEDKDVAPLRHRIVAVADTR